MDICVVLLAAIVAVSSDGRPTLVRLGGDPARGVLVNVMPGSQPFDPPDPARPTVVFIHGLNPMPRTVHFAMAEQLAEALARRFGPAFNVLGWDWNAASLVSVQPRVNDENSVEQGRSLAAALCRAGIVPSRTHLIGHSSGCIVAASAARALASAGGPSLAQLTMLDPATFYYELVFEHLDAGSAAWRVENYWTPGPSGFGREVALAGVWNVRVTGPTPNLGVIFPLRSNHLYLVEWYIATAAGRGTPSGFNTSLFLQGIGS